MMLYRLTCISTAILALGVIAAQAAPSTFQQTCSNIEFSYSGSNAAVSATCLKRDGTPNSTSVLIQGVSNQNGKLTQGSGASSFQASCGNIQIIVDGPFVSISAICRASNGSSNSSTIDLLGVKNNNGVLSY